MFPLLWAAGSHLLSTHPILEWRKDSVLAVSLKLEFGSPQLPPDNQTTSPKLLQKTLGQGLLELLLDTGLYSAHCCGSSLEQHTKPLSFASSFLVPLPQMVVWGMMKSERSKHLTHAVLSKLWPPFLSLCDSRSRHSSWDIVVVWRVLQGGSVQQLCVFLLKMNQIYPSALLEAATFCLCAVTFKICSHRHIYAKLVFLVLK